MLEEILTIRIRKNRIGRGKENVLVIKESEKEILDSINCLIWYDSVVIIPIATIWCYFYEIRNTQSSAVTFLITLFSL
jgi:hypothetical protein